MAVFFIPFKPVKILFSNMLSEGEYSHKIHLPN